MPDLLTHALIGYIIATTASFRYDWLTPPWVTICMMGTFIPDLTKIKLVVSSYQIEQFLGVPFDWFALHTVGGRTRLSPHRNRPGSQRVPHACLRTARGWSWLTSLLRCASDHDIGLYVADALADYSLQVCNAQAVSLE